MKVIQQVLHEYMIFINYIYVSYNTDKTKCFALK